MIARPVCSLAVLVAISTAPAAGQAGRRCLLRIDKVARQGVSTNIIGTNTTNYFAGGDLELSCQGQNVRIWADSLASYAGTVVQFIGSFRYEDSTSRVTSDFGTYYKDAERWEARGNVHYTDRQNGSELRGPSADYLRAVRGIREQEELYADQRPTLRLAARDSANRVSDPYVVVADRIRMRGDDQMWAGGNVTVDRTDLRGRSDSLQLDTGKGSAGALIGRASIRRAATDSFALAGRRIDLGFDKQELSSVVGRDSATLKSEDLDLAAATIKLSLVNRAVVQTLAWGTSPRPSALADEYQVRGDSLAVDTPNEVLRELRAFGQGWIGFRPDTAKGEQDYLTGDTVVATFLSYQGSKGQASALQTLNASRSATVFYRVNKANAPGGRPSITYSRADRIKITMIGTDSVKIDKVELVGAVDGLQLEPEAVRRNDSTRIRPEVAPLRPRGPDER